VPPLHSDGIHRMSRWEPSTSSAASSRPSSTAPSPPRRPRSATPSRRCPSRCAASRRASAPAAPSAGARCDPDRGRHAVRPHAERALQALDDARQAAAAVRDVVTGTVRFGMFGTARVYFGAELVAALLERPIPTCGWSSSARTRPRWSTRSAAARLEAGVVGLPIDDHGLACHPLMHDELVYVSAHPERTRSGRSTRARSPRTRSCCRRRAGATRTRPDGSWPAWSRTSAARCNHASRSRTSRPRSRSRRAASPTPSSPAGCSTGSPTACPAASALGAARPTAGRHLRDRAPAGRDPVPSDPGRRGARPRPHGGAGVPRRGGGTHTVA
jgi:hypothetical protein